MLGLAVGGSCGNGEARGPTAVEKLEVVGHKWVVRQPLQVLADNVLLGNIPALAASSTVAPVAIATLQWWLCPLFSAVSRGTLQYCVHYMWKEDWRSCG